MRIYLLIHKEYVYTIRKRIYSLDREDYVFVIRIRIDL